MGIHKRRTDPIRVVSIATDDAIDRERTLLVDYIRTRNPALVKEVAGHKVTWFELAPMDASQAAYVKTLKSPECELHAFLSGCRSCTDPELLPATLWEGDAGQRRIRFSAADTLPDGLWTELGRIVIELGHLSMGEGPRFSVPRGLPLTLRRATSMTADSAANAPTATESNG